MSARRLGLAVLLGIALTFAIPFVIPRVAYAQCGGPVFPPCPPGGDAHKRPTKTPIPPIATATTAASTPQVEGKVLNCGPNCPFLTITPVGGVQLPPRNSGTPLLGGLSGLLGDVCAGGAAVGGLGLLIGLGVMASNRSRTRTHGGSSEKVTGSARTGPPEGVEPGLSLNTSSLINGGQIFPSGNIPSAQGAPGTLGGIDGALNRDGLPGIGSGGYGDDDGNPNPTVPGTGALGGGRGVGNITPDDSPGGNFPAGGYWVNDGDTLSVYRYDANQKAQLVSITPVRWLKDPNPMDDAPSGGSIPRDGAGNIRPHGDVLGLDGSGLPGSPPSLHGDLANLGKLNQQANLGNSSGPGNSQQAGTDPNPDSNGPDRADASDLKQIIDPNSPAIDHGPG